MCFALKLNLVLRYFIHLAYNGTLYNGWQIQPNAPSVQETLNKALHVLVHPSIKITGAGRTDTGVHAKQMFAHFDFETTIETKKLISKLNNFLPEDVVVIDIMLVQKESHARFDAVSRTYQYYINTKKNPFINKQSWYYSKELDVNLMNQAAQMLLLYTDFECFSKVNTDVATYNCQITEAFWIENNNELVFTISANRFLRNMVRSIVGTLVNVGLKKTSLLDFEKIIESKKRENAGFSVPAHGLFLTKIEYPYL